MTTEKRAALMRKGACFICEEPEHMARNHKEYEAKKGGKYFTPTEEDDQGDTCSPSGTIITGTKELLVLQSTSQKKEEKEEKEDDEDF